MLRTLLQFFLWPFFRCVKIEPDAKERLVDVHQNATVIHVFRTRRMTDPLFLIDALKKLKLPLPRWMHDHPGSRTALSATSLASAVQEGASSVLFLRKPRTLANSSSQYPENYIEALVALQKKSSKPILLVPEALLCSKRAVGLRRTIVDVIFGDRDAPGIFRELIGFLWRADESRYYVGVPIDLKSFVEREAGQPEPQVARKIRWALLNHLSREEEIRTGPAYRPAFKTWQMVLNDPSVRSYLKSQSEKGKDSVQEERRAARYIQTIAADMRSGWLRVLDIVVDIIWTRIYDGIIVDQEGLKEIRRAARKGALVLVPSHKSHIDYMVLTQVFFKAGLVPPHVAAGDNLNFPPIGKIFRRAGAFFIRRSFRGNRLYSVVFAAYVRRLLKEGHAVEFFIEGGRSRTGKLLQPRTGLLGICVDPVLDGALSDLSFVPVSVNYEKIIEAESYAKELDGAEKKKEDVSSLLSTTRILRSRYGRVYVDFGQVISLKSFIQTQSPDWEPQAARSSSDETDTKNEGRNALVSSLGQEIVHGMNRAARVTPSALAALALLCRPVRVVAENDFYDSAKRMLIILKKAGARVSPLLDKTSVRPALREAIGRFAADDLIQMSPGQGGQINLQLDRKGRRTLDYYKNNVLHFLVPCAAIEASLISHGREPIDRAALLKDVHQILYVLRLEFSFGYSEAELSFALNVLLESGIMQSEGPEEYHASPQAVGELAALLFVFLEAYLVVARVAQATSETSEKNLTRLGLNQIERDLSEGKLRYPEGAVKHIVQNAARVVLADKLSSESRESALNLEKWLGPPPAPQAEKP